MAKIGAVWGGRRGRGQEGINDRLDLQEELLESLLETFTSWECGGGMGGRKMRQGCWC